MHTAPATYCDLAVTAQRFVRHAADCLMNVQGGEHAQLHVVFLSPWRVVDSQDLVPYEFQQRAVELLDNIGNYVGYCGQQVQHLLRHQALTTSLEPIDVTEEDCGTAPHNTNLGFQTGCEQALHDCRRHILAPRSNGTPHRLEGLLQTLKLLRCIQHRFTDNLGWQILVDVRQLQVGQNNHVVQQRSQRLQQHLRKFGDLGVQDPDVQQEQGDNRQSTQYRPSTILSISSGSVDERNVARIACRTIDVRPTQLKNFYRAESGLHELRRHHIKRSSGSNPHLVCSDETAPLIPMQPTIQNDGDQSVGRGVELKVRANVDERRLIGVAMGRGRDYAELGQALLSADIFHVRREHL
mmetsp:Transcript_54049/g.156079  ORF Transcript_54049/g.156079 Transcript_54049/m.156079 type:complete len:353 (+) Transcript_54049:1027-2085(+)